jgi:Predicted membrane protein
VSTGTILVVAGAFLASAVEMVEALTIVLGVGVVRGWRSTLIGAGSAGVVLGILVAALGPALGSIPIESLRLVVGALLLAFGMQWLRKAILRSSGYKELHDEEAAFRSERAQAAAARDDRRGRLDWYSFTVAFKGVLLEGLEVVFIVIAFGSAQGQLGLAAAGAAAALVIVVLAGVVAKGPLSRVPENTIKFAVGLLLTSFGSFWGAEGAGVDWPGDELSLLGVIAFFGLVSYMLVRALRRRRRVVPVTAEAQA